MKPASAALVALLASDQFIMADLYTFTLIGGSVLRYSAAPTALTVNGNTFALGPKFERSKVTVQVGTQIDELEIKVYADTTDLIGATLFLQAAWTGELDGALLQLERAFMPAYGDTSAGTVVLFAGRISDIDCTRSGLDIKCRSHLELLNIQMPRRLWQASCTHIFGGPMCRFNRASLGLNFAAAANSTTTVIQGAPSSTTPFNQGTIVGVTGANAGQSRTITSFVSAANVTVKLPFLSPVGTGDQFQLLPGCDRTLATCTSIFSNAIHFGGFPFIPTPETAV